jgi:eukaryotic-like serine/threonine-protein kinase
VIGKTLGHYQITGEIGKGGMGEVYRAKDLVLGRDVAIKVLPDEFAKDSDRLVRFQREAKVLASLNHPNIAIIHGLEESDGVSFLVLELVEGETLAQRIAAGPTTAEDAIKIALQIVDALEAAHARSIVHRDLKPANVKITPEDRVKVLDFGLAKAMEKKPAQAPLSDSPTLSAAVSQAGVILGTAAYMSPEQAKGLEADLRSDVFSFGCVLYEMLTGRQPFQGETVSEILASVLIRDPDLGFLPSGLNPRLYDLVRRCLEKNPKRRWQAVGDLRSELETVAVEPRATLPVSPLQPQPLWRRAIPFAIAAIAFAFIGSVATWMLKCDSPGRSLGVVRLSVALPDIRGNLPIAISPDGRTLAYSGSGGLYSRSIDSTDARLIPGTQGASEPFFSPDGHWIGFFDESKLKKVSRTGGALQVLCDMRLICENPGNRGGSWAPDNTIYFAPSSIAGLWKVPASGGAPQALTKLDRAKGEVSHRWPQVLPDGSGVLFTVWTGPGWDEKHLQVCLFQNRERHVLLPAADTGRYVSSGHLVYFRPGSGTLMAAPFDLASLAVGLPVAVTEGVREGGEGAPYAVSNSGMLVYIQGSVHQYERQLIWVDRKGTITPLPVPEKLFVNLRLSPDGRYAAIDALGATRAVWIYDIAHGTMNPLKAAGSSQFPIWTPDSQRIIYRGTRTGYRNLYWRAADGSGEEERLTPPGEGNEIAYSVSPDAKWLAFTEDDGRTWLLPLDGDHKPQLFMNNPARASRFSPDGRWIAYASYESGRNEVYVRPFPGPGGKTPVSTEGGSAPNWSHDGRELFYRQGDKMMVVQITMNPAFAVSTPKMLFERPGVYDVAPDGQRFLMIQGTAPEPPIPQINVVLNWLDELKQRVPAK